MDRQITILKKIDPTKTEQTTDKSNKTILWHPVAFFRGKSHEFATWDVPRWTLETLHDQLALWRRQASGPRWLSPSVKTAVWAAGSLGRYGYIDIWYVKKKKIYIYIYT